MQLYTTRVQLWRKFEGTDIEFIDTTVKTNNSIWKPTWEMVMAVKANPTDEGRRAYTIAYKRLIKFRLLANPGAFEEFLRKDKVAIGCFCPADTFCHRLLMIELIEILCKRLEIPFEYLGEYK